MSQSELDLQRQTMPTPHDKLAVACRTEPTNRAQDGSVAFDVSLSRTRSLVQAIAQERCARSRKRRGT